MIKIYASKAVEQSLLPILAEFRCRTVLNYPIKNVTRKQRGARSAYKVVNYPIN